MTSIKVIQDFEDKSIKDTILPVLEEAYRDVRELIPALPEELNIYFDNWCLIPDLGVGGAAYDPNTITVSYDSEFEGDKDLQLKELRATLFHEAYHIAHGWTFEGNTAVGDRVGNALEQAFYEGSATVFEREFGDVDPMFGDYSELENIEELFEEVKSLGVDYDVDAWKFWHEDKKERWILYRVGTWMIDEYLKKNKDKTILDLLKLKLEDILQALAV